MLDITALEPVPPESVPEPSRSTWGLKHQLRLVGIVLVLAALAIGMWRWLQPPVSVFNEINPEKIQRTCQKLPPSQTWDYWEYLKQGLDRRTDQQYARDVAVHQFWQIAVAAAALLGFVLIVAGTIGINGCGKGTGPCFRPTIDPKNTPSRRKMDQSPDNP